MLKANGVPVFDFATYFMPPWPAGTQVAATLLGNEVISITNPVPGFYTVTVLNYSQVSNVPFTLKVTLTAPQPAAGGGGGCAITPRASFDPTLLLLLSLFSLVKRRSVCLTSMTMGRSPHRAR